MHLICKEAASEKGSRIIKFLTLNTEKLQAICFYKDTAEAKRQKMHKIDQETTNM